MLGNPMYVPVEATPEELEEKRRELENELLGITRMADDYFTK
jgi:hypothetical protein